MALFNDINQIQSLVENFLEVIKPLLQDRKVDTLKLNKPINAACFPYEIKDEEKLGSERKGVYIFWAIDKLRNLLILYVGKGYIENRFYTHIGPEYCWERNGSPARFPHNFTVNNHPYVNDEIKEIITNAKFNVSFIPCSDDAILCLIESFLIAALEPKINIECVSQETLIARKNN